ncbi:MAG: cobalamin biosynthesis protein [Lachnospiraceae bacterium]|nr:cobalamin biosynthesis protein [Lachnospiraceae bacterium]
MNKIAICFTEKGAGVLERLRQESEKKGIRPPECFAASKDADLPDGFTRIGEPIANWTASVFKPGNALIFVGALGIAVRAIAGLVKDKLSDCPVVVIDDNGQFVIPVLSGHVQGANKLAVTLAELLSAVPVITTATDVNEVFSADVFAVENRLSIANREGIKKVSAKALEGKKVTLSIKDYPPKEPVDVIVADETDAEYSLLLRPKRYTVGIGMKKGKDPAMVERFFLEILSERGLTPADVYALCTIDVKEEEEALIQLRDRYAIPLLAFDKDLLKMAPGNFAGSSFVEETVGVDNVCERSAVLGAGRGGRLVAGKQARDGMTMAIAERG